MMGVISISGKSNGQTFMPDFLGSILVFALLITLFFSAWNSVLSDQTEFKQEDEMRLQGRHTTTFLVSTRGDPEDWNSTNVRIPGFARPDQVIQAEKLEEFRDIDYERQKDLMKAENFYLAIRNSSMVVKYKGDELEFGKNYSDGETVIPFTRNVRLNRSGKISSAKLRYVVWQ